MSIVGDTKSPSPPTLVSIGSFLIDEFDQAPRPIIDPLPPPSPKSVPPPPPPRQHTPVPSSPTRPWTPTLGRGSPSPKRQQAPPHISTAAPAPAPPAQTTLDSPGTTSTGSGPGTPQRDFDNSTPPPNDPIEYLGGGALYALIGGRMFLPAQELRVLVDVARGKADLRPDLLAQVESFGPMWIWNEGQETRMTRSRIRYDGDVRLYHPMLKPPHRTLSDLVGTPLEQGAYMHISPPFSSEDVWTLQAELESYSAGRNGQGEGMLGAWRPKLVFEPTPPSCHAGQRPWLEKVAPGLHVLSPNHEELLSFYNHPKMPLSHPRLAPTIESIVQHLLHNVGVGQDGLGIVVIRSGRMGCCVGTKQRGIRWFPAFYESADADKVKDVTGAGNAFIGGYVAGLKLTNEDAYQAVLYGTVAASYVVEQIGLPTLSKQGGTEIWNDEPTSERLDRLRKKWIETGLL